ncbi:MAG TPA: glycosyltransferase family 39 protein [Planctomycetota bacterium]|nr:glycosyltransferase family 39 protein [Planctomycetota bacterium]
MTPRRLAFLVLGLEALLLLAGQWGRDLMTMDDLREAEVAREMSTDGSYVIPHLAGLPFVEKPPGFQMVVAGLFTLLGGPSILAARLVSAAFALAALVSVYLLGATAYGPRGGVLAGAFLAFSPLFVRVSHEILLDNALLAAMGWTFYFLFRALTEPEMGPKRRAYAAAALALGISFLVKGLVGPSLVGAGFVTFLIVSRRWNELRGAIHVYPATAFLAPCLVWIIPFLRAAPRELVEEFFIKNQFGRFFQAYASHARPFYFYLQTIGYKLGLAVFFLPGAWWVAWRDRKKPEALNGLVLAALGAGPFLLLSLSKAKDAVYLLPVYPAFSVAAAGWGLRVFAHDSRAARGLAGFVLAVGVGVALAAGIVTARLGGLTLGVAFLGVIFLPLGLSLFLALSRRDAESAGAGVAAFLAVGGLLWMTGPIARYEATRQEWRASLPVILRATEGKELLLFRPDDEIRGAYGFYRSRTALELNRPIDFVQRLGDHADTLGLVVWQGPALPMELLEASRALSRTLVERTRAKYYDKELIVVSAAP